MTAATTAATVGPAAETAPARGVVAEGAPDPVTVEAVPTAVAPAPVPVPPASAVGPGTAGRPGVPGEVVVLGAGGVVVVPAGAVVLDGAVVVVVGVGAAVVVDEVVSGVVVAVVVDGSSGGVVPSADVGPTDEVVAASDDVVPGAGVLLPAPDAERSECADADPSGSSEGWLRRVNCPTTRVGAASAGRSPPCSRNPTPIAAATAARAARVPERDRFASRAVARSSRSRFVTAFEVARLAADFQACLDIDSPHVAAPDDG